MPRVITDICISCGSCQSVCPVECIDEGPTYSIRYNECIDCGSCEAVCPVGAIEQDA